jgi:phospholipase/carboxylesterase
MEGKNSTFQTLWVYMLPLVKLEASTTGENRDSFPSGAPIVQRTYFLRFFAILNIVVNGYEFLNKGIDMLEILEIEPSVKAQASIIWLHGLGGSGAEFAQLVRAEPKLSRLPARFIFPNAPIQPVAINNNFAMPAWYNILGFGASAEQDVLGIKESTKKISQLIELETAKGILSNKIILAGFSQGGAVAMYTALTYAQPLGGVMALSTYLPIAGHMMTERHVANQDLNILISHGIHDDVLPLRWAEISKDVLQANQYKVDFKLYPMRHEMNRQSIDDCCAWLHNRVSAKI